MSKYPVKIYVGGSVTAEQNKRIQNLLFGRVSASNLPQSGPLTNRGSYPSRSNALEVASELVKLGVPFDMFVLGRVDDQGTVPDQKLVFRPADSKELAVAYCDGSGQPIGPKDDPHVARVAELWGDLPDYVAAPLRYNDSKLTYDDMYQRLRMHETEDKYYGHEDPRDANSRFRLNLYRVLDIESHPKRDKLFEIAWEEGHSEGLGQVLYYAEKFSELLV